MVASVTNQPTTFYLTPQNKKHCIDAAKVGTIFFASIFGYSALKMCANGSGSLIMFLPRRLGKTLGINSYVVKLKNTPYCTNFVAKQIRGYFTPDYKNLAISAFLTFIPTFGFVKLEETLKNIPTQSDVHEHTRI